MLLDNSNQYLLTKRCGHISQGNLTILPTEVVNLPIETGSGGCHTPAHPLAPGLPQLAVTLTQFISGWIIQNVIGKGFREETIEVDVGPEDLFRVSHIN